MKDLIEVGDRVNKHSPWRASLVAQMVKNTPAMRETWVQSLVWEDPLEKYSVQYAGLENSMDREAWQATVHGATKSQIRLSGFHCHFSCEENRQVDRYLPWGLAGLGRSDGNQCILARQRAQHKKNQICLRMVPQRGWYLTLTNEWWLEKMFQVGGTACAKACLLFFLSEQQSCLCTSGWIITTHSITQPAELEVPLHTDFWQLAEPLPGSASRFELFFPLQNFLTLKIFETVYI